MNDTAYLIVTIDATARVSSAGIYSEWPLAVMLNRPERNLLVTQTMGRSYQEARDALVRMVNLEPYYQWVLPFMRRP